METISSAQSPEKTNPEEYDLVILGGGTGSAISAWLPYKALRDAILTHPTLVEGLIPLFSSVPSVPKSAAAKG